MEGDTTNQPSGACGECRKRVLVSAFSRTREVAFVSDGSESDETVLKKEVSEAFKDVIPPKNLFFFQRKALEWDGEFVDLASGQEVPDRSILKVVAVTVPLQTSPVDQVCPLAYAVNIHADSLHHAGLSLQGYT